MHVLERTQSIGAPISEVFAFFSQPANLGRLTPPWLNFRIHGNSPQALAPGARIEYRIRWLALTLRWVTRISRWSPPVEFQDVQEKGPYRTWRHTHRFDPATGGGVVIRDRVEYELPLGILGRLAHRLVVRRQLEAVFDYRAAAVTRLFAPPESAAPEVRP